MYVTLFLYMCHTDFLYQNERKYFFLWKKVYFLINYLTSNIIVKYIQIHTYRRQIYTSIQVTWHAYICTYILYVFIDSLWIIFCQSILLEIFINREYLCICVVCIIALCVSINQHWSNIVGSILKDSQSTVSQELLGSTNLGNVVKALCFKTTPYV